MGSSLVLPSLAQHNSTIYWQQTAVEQPLLCLLVQTEEGLLFWQPLGSIRAILLRSRFAIALLAQSVLEAKEGRFGKAQCRRRSHCQLIRRTI
ncbi:hypothetical protein [Scytonema sp. PCC 10023]|uniref:hypothetical protein n=1 Tax=Scytonema sp. PCC 10023 TaxID=1680591 RepID=UPI0039C5D14D